MNTSSLGQNTLPKLKKKNFEAEGEKIKLSVQETSLGNLGQPIESDKDNVLNIQFKISFLEYSTDFS